MAKMPVEEPEQVPNVEIKQKKVKKDPESKKDKKDKKEKKQKKRKLEDSGIEIADGELVNGEIKIETSDQEEKPAKDKKKKRKLEAQVNGEVKTETSDQEEKGTKDKKKKKRKSTGNASVNGQDAHKEGTEKSDDENKDAENAKQKTEIEIEGDFSNFNLSDKTVKKLKARGVKYLFPVQAKTYHHVFKGIDVLAQARTGTGKTFSFAIPLVEKLKDNPQTKVKGRLPKVIGLAPTRELAKQVADDFASITDNLTVLCVYGGTPYSPQESVIRRGVDIVIGTPGRVLDFLNKGTLKLTDVEHCILDEVDHMLDMGFAEDVEAILKFAYDREEGKPPQTLLFSATMPAWVFKTAKKYMKHDALKLDLIGKEGVQTATNVQHLAIKCGFQERAATIGDMIQVYSGNMGRAIVFCQTKREADELCMGSAIKLETHVMHGDIPQEKREKVLKKFREGRYKCLVTTDVAARGLDIPEVDLVIQCSPPRDLDSYIHRSGRTGRAGRSGTCVCFYKPQEEYDLRRVETRAGIKFKKVGPPSAEDIINAAATDAVRSIETVKVSEEILSQFQASAEKLIEEQGAVKALSAALALISGSTDVKSRSLLSAKEGFTTYHFQTTVEMRGLGYAWKSLERHIPSETREQIVRMRPCANKLGCVFDIPSQLESVLEDHWQDGHYDTLIKATELPELVESEIVERPRNRGGRDGGRGGRFRGQRGGGGRDRRGGNRGRGMKRSYGGNRSSNGPSKRTKFN